MLVKKNIFLLISILFFSISNYAQNKRLDSLINLSKSAKDTLLIKTLNEISWEYKSSNVDTALFYAKSALEKSLEIDGKKSIADS